MRRRYHTLTPEQAWHRYGNGANVEFFITDYFYAGYTDIWDMCQQDILERICRTDGPVTIEERTHVTRLFYQYIRNYIDSKGGIEKLELLSQREMDFVWDDELAKLVQDLKELQDAYQKRRAPVLTRRSASRPEKTSDPLV